MSQKLSIILSLILLMGISHSKTINIPDDFSKIQDGISNATDGDTILVEPGTYFENINFLGKNITVASNYLTTLDTSYINNTIIDASNSGTVVKFMSGEDSTALLCGFTIQNGAGTGDEFAVKGGAGLKIQNSAPTIKGCTIKSNWGVPTGGILCENSTLHLNKVIVKDNYGYDGYGYSRSRCGGIDCINSKLYCDNVLIENNESDISGGLNLNESRGILKNAKISNNRQGDAGEGAGGIHCHNNSKLILHDSEIYNNISSFIYIPAGISIVESEAHLDYVDIIDNPTYPMLFRKSEVNISNSTIYPNQSSYQGDYVNIMQESNVNLHRTLIYGNIALFECWSSNLNIINSTLYNITPQKKAAGFFQLNNKSAVTIINSIIYSDDKIETDDSTVINVAFSNIKSGKELFENDEDHTINWLDGNITSNPGFVDPENNNFELTDTSPCIEAGIPFLTYEGDTLVDLTEDQYFGTAPDIGAVENQDSSLIRSINTKLSLITPQNNSTIIHFPVTFKWKPVGIFPSLTKYNLFISLNSNMSESIIKKDIPDTNYVLDTLSLISERYYWKVEAENIFSGKTYRSKTNCIKIIDKFHLSQNYPNPFNTLTWIDYKLPLKKIPYKVKIQIYDIQGRIIKAYNFEDKSSGEYSIKWDGTNSDGIHVSNGIYIYRIKAGDFIQSKKMILLK